MIFRVFSSSEGSETVSKKSNDSLLSFICLIIGFATAIVNPLFQYLPLYSSLILVYFYLIYSYFINHLNLIFMIFHKSSISQYNDYYFMPVIRFIFIPCQ